MVSALTPRTDRQEANAKLGQALAIQQGITNLCDVALINASTSNSLPVNSCILNTDTTPRFIYDLANDLSARIGIDRIMCQQIYPIQTEIGTGSNSGSYNGTVDQPVWGVTGDKNNQIRFVGGGWVGATTGSGTNVATVTVGDYVEIIFYGTGLNILSQIYSDARDARASIDGGTEGSNIFPGATGSNILANRNYAVSNTLAICSGLTLGWHVVRIRFAATAAFVVYGVEILNESSTLNIRPGTVYGNSDVNVLATVQTPTYNTVFESGTVGTKGGCVAVYLKSDGTIGKAITPTDSATPLYLTNTSHANEEMIRQYNWREFGASRADDFSLITGTGVASKAFTLDDGTNTLTSTLPTVTATGCVSIESNGHSITLTFIGTGLDIVRQDSTSGTAPTQAVTIDGAASVGNLSTVALATIRTEKICSGLPYGTHVFKITATSAVSISIGILAFKVYAPKLPVIPTGAVLINQYYLMADYTASSTALTDVTGVGVLRKMGTREFVYIGSAWTTPYISVGSFNSGTNIVNSASSVSVQYTFFGTGIELRSVTNAVVVNNTITIDGISNLSVYTTSLVQSGSGITWTNTTGTLGGTSSATNYYRISISGLTIGKHTVVLTNVNGNPTYYVDNFDIITPLHYPKNLNETDGVSQNSLLVGSCALGDKRNLPTITKPQKVWAQAIGLTSAPTTTSALPVPCIDMSITVNSPGALFDIYFLSNMYHSTNGNMLTYIYVDGIVVPPGANVTSPAAGNAQLMLVVQATIYLSKGVHKIDGYWSTNLATMTALAVNRKLTVVER